MRERKDGDMIRDDTQNSILGFHVTSKISVGVKFKSKHSHQNESSVHSMLALCLVANTGNFISFADSSTA